MIIYNNNNNNNNNNKKQKSKKNKQKKVVASSVSLPQRSDLAPTELSVSASAYKTGALLRDEALR